MCNPRILAALCCSLILAHTVRAEDRTVATVNGTKIMLSEVDKVLNRMAPKSINVAAGNRWALRREVLSMMIDDLLVDDFLKRYAPAVNRSLINQKMSELAVGLKAKGKTLKEYFQSTGQTEEQIRKSLIRMYQWNGYTQKHVSDQQIRDYYRAYRDFFNKVVVRASHIAMKAPVPTSSLEEQKLINHLKEIRQEVVSGKISFADAARKYSKCPSASQGGDIGTFPRKYIVDENFAQAAFNLVPGEVSEVVRTQYGFHIIKVTEKKEGKATEYEKIKDEVREHYISELRQGILKQIRKSAKIELSLN